MFCFLIYFIFASTGIWWKRCYWNENISDYKCKSFWWEIQVTSATQMLKKRNIYIHGLAQGPQIYTQVSGFANEVWTALNFLPSCQDGKKPAMWLFISYIKLFCTNPAWRSSQRLISKSLSLPAGHSWRENKRSPVQDPTEGRIVDKRKSSNLPLSPLTNINIILSQVKGSGESVKDDFLQTAIPGYPQKQAPGPLHRAKSANAQLLSIKWHGIGTHPEHILLYTLNNL